MGKELLYLEVSNFRKIDVQRITNDQTFWCGAETGSGKRRKRSTRFPLKRRLYSARPVPVAQLLRIIPERSTNAVSE